MCISIWSSACIESFHGALPVDIPNIPILAIPIHTHIWKASILFLSHIYVLRLIVHSTHHFSPISSWFPDILKNNVFIVWNASLNVLKTYFLSNGKSKLISLIIIKSQILQSSYFRQTVEDQLTDRYYMVSLFLC